MHVVRAWGLIAATTLGLAGVLRGDIIVERDGSVAEGKIIARNAGGLSVQVDGAEGRPPLQLGAAQVARVVEIDANGAETAEAEGIAKPAKRVAPHWTTPAEPSAPPIAPPSKDPTYYLIPLHGEVGETCVADILEKSLADAAKRKATVVVLDIDSPGGVISEAELMAKVLQRYGKDLRIVALVNQDRSAAALATLAVREVYIKSGGTLGATAPHKTNPDDAPGSPKEELAAWRVVAKACATQGGHEPLLAEALVDNTLELHLETVNGKKVVKEGPGTEMLTRPDKILTLTSHEAVALGLAVDMADDLDELSGRLHLTGWKEVQGVGKLLVDYIPQRRAAFQKQAQAVDTEFRATLAEAARIAPWEGQRSGTIPGAMGGGPRMIVEMRALTPAQRAQWKADSLSAVVGLLKAEQLLQDEISLADALGQKVVAEELKGELARLGDARATLYADRNKHADEPPVITAGDAGALNLKYAPLPVRLADLTRQAIAEKNYAAGEAPRGSMYQDRETTEDTAPDGGVLIGLRCGWEKLGGGEDGMTALQPIYLTSKGVVLGKLLGNPEATMTAEVVAREGYAVGGVKMDRDVPLRGLQLRFVRIADGRVVPGDTYQSAPVGIVDDPMIVGGGMPTIGIKCRTINQFCAAFTLLQMNPPASKPLSDLPPITGSRAPLADNFAAAVKEGIQKKSIQVGGTSGSIDAHTDFKEIAPDGGILIGLRCGKGNERGTETVVSLQPVFLTPNGEVLGKVYGDAAAAPVVEFKAPPGFAIGGATVGGFTALDALTVTYMKIGDRALLTDEAYTSDRMGTGKEANLGRGSPGRTRAFGGDGTPIVGICGKADQGKLTLGLVFLTTTERGKANP